MNRIVAVVVVLLVVIGLVGSGAAYIVHKQHADAVEADRVRVAAAKAEASAKYRRLSDLQSRASAALDHFSELQTAYDEKYTEGGAASHKRHDLVDSQPYDIADGLALINQEKAAVESLQSLTPQKADAARAAARVFTDAYGDAATSTIISDISVASEAEGAGLSDWWHATRELVDWFSARANGRYYGSTGNVGELYKSSDDEAARSRERWATVTDRFATLRNRLDRGVSEAQSRSGDTVAASVSLPTPAAPRFTLPSNDQTSNSTQTDAPSPGQMGGQTQAVVKQFYADINTHRFNEAYAMLSNEFRTAQSLQSFRDGYRTTLSVRADTSVADDPSIVTVNLIARDRKAGSDAIVTTRYSGYWHVIWSDARHGWVMDDARFSKAPLE
jgi:hypothetical protein